MTSAALPTRIDRMPRAARKDEARLEAARVIACALNSVPYQWWRAHKGTPPLSETSEPVRAVLAGLRYAGLKIVPMEGEDLG